MAEFAMTEESVHKLPGVQAAGQNCPATIIRFAILCHLIAVTAFLAFTLADRGLFLSHSVSRFLMDYCGIIFVLSVVVSWICPIAVAVQLFRGNLSATTRFFAFVAEAALFIAQFIVLLPGCM